ncbi:efflux RND transporter permease subunit [Xanthomonas translucens]|uniref:efflux RND transporter permease subunit n=3 Tax=Xanthomonas campestris pv. translucens TaxID=343 RepID=UPI0002A7ABBF|nr:efflux RND transporter permease subunit [Xanthomonas translucens]AKK66386.1 acriflavine resistance protein B [Xanthomonas translucens pv. undulosa]ELQ17228.1 rnd superfamily protein [Xanthomonas translucens DAR61454]MBC3970953.1 efflux RND transporter permease subunit [Xanthomonas translucens pv. undulosa]MCT8270205.1 efflux RND transporter permease subunit [Xanthomonas translucens pv. undulosa]MCT8281899.1 efflux RND transporter permease subunit [Xanthomonas translucens pv. undulosa]
MGFSTIFIRRPIATTLLMAGVLLLGILGYRQLPVSALPEIDAPSLVVTTQYPGANASTMASLVTTPLERQLGQISGLQMMTSDSSAGLSTIILQFAMDRDIDIAAQDVQGAIRQSTLPSSLPYQPVYNRVNPADAAILTLKLSSDTLPLRDVNNYADSILAQRLSQVPGVGLVSIAGNVRPAVRIQVNPAQLSNMGLTMEALRSALTETNVNAPKGSLNGKTQSYSIGTNDQLSSAADYRDTVISYRNGAPVRLSDVAQVVDGVENDQLAAWADGKPAVLLEIRRQPGANIVQTVEQIRAILPQLQGVLPRGVHLDVFSDRTETIRASVHEVKFTLILTIFLVVAVIFVFLRRLWATIIPSVAVPLSLAGTFAVMAFAGMSLDNLSLMALVVATGFVVDDAIVMIENIVRYIEQGKSGREAAEIGAKQIGFTVLSLTVSLVAVFLPLILMPGVTGRLFHEFAWVLSIAVVISMLVSLTLTPMMCAYLLKPDALPEGEDAHERAAAAGKTTVWTRTVALYERTLDWVLGHQPLTLAIALATMVLTVVLYVVIPKGLLPEQDTGLITGVVQADQNVAFPQMQQRTEAVAAALRKDPAVTGVAAFIGAGSMNPTLNQGQLSIVLKARADRDGLDEVLPRLQKAVAGLPGVALYLKPVQDVTLDTRVAATEYQYSLSDVDSAELATQGARLTEALRKRPELADVDNNLANQGRALELTVDRDKASALGVPMQTIDDTLYDAFGQRQISTIFTQLNQYRVVLEVAPQFRNSTALLHQLAVTSNGSGALTASNATSFGQTTSSNSSTATGIGNQNTGIAVGSGGTVPLAALAAAKVTTTPLVVSHQQQLPAVTVSFNLAPGYSLSQAVAAIEETREQLQLPPQLHAEFIGKAAEFTGSQADIVWLLLASVVLIYIVLGVLYESYIHPLTIISTLPPAGVGALLALMLCGLSLSVDGIVGIVLLIGIVKKNAIMMIDFAIDARREGANAHDAIRRACLLRFRPIMMTTAAAMLGALPLALGDGIGSELRRPLGIAIVGGLLLSQLVTLYTTPVIYLYMERASERLRAYRERRVAAAERLA